MINAVRKLLAHPATRDLSIDDPRTTEKRKQIIHQNRFLWRIYDEWYRALSACIPTCPGAVLELGSGAGFLAEYLPELITSEVFFCSGVQVVFGRAANAVFIRKPEGNSDGGRYPPCP